MPGLLRDPGFGNLTGSHNRAPAASRGMGRIWLRTEVERVDIAGLAHAAQSLGAEGFKAAEVARGGGELGRDEHLTPERLAQRLDPRHLIDGRADDREVEAVD